MFFMKRDDLIKKIDKYLDISSFNGIDISLNGLQVGGPNRDIKIIGFAVDACLETIEKAIEDKIDVLIVHHGLYWGSPIAITGNFYKKIELLINNNIDLYAAHLPLDAHMEVGNNKAMATALNLTDVESAFNYNGLDIGVVGLLKEALDIDEIASILNFTNPIKLDFSNEPIKKIAIVSGEGAHDVHEAKALGCQLLITGEARHSEYHYCKEENISMLCGGHYQSETFGVKSLAVELSKKHKLLIKFIDVPTGL
jgi:dinuclear metal center YbgI/SA1388 family protein